jgi:hypothetical protein
MNVNSVGIASRNRYWPTTFHNTTTDSQREMWSRSSWCDEPLRKPALKSEGADVRGAHAAKLVYPELQCLSVLCSNSSVQDAVTGGNAV